MESTTVRFSKSEFEEALGKAVRASVEETGYDATIGRKAMQGEWQYHVRIADTNKRIVVRSSIPSNDEVASGTGEDSIRIWGQYYWAKRQCWNNMAKKTRWTTRVPGWEHRMALKVKETYEECLLDSNKAIPNPNKTIEAQGPRVQGEDAPATQETPNKRNGRDARRSSCSTRGATGFAIALGDESQALETGELKAKVNPEPALISLGDEAATLETDEEEAPAPKTEPNPSQREAIESDPDSATRVLAPPGSGKTYVIERRVAHLIELGVDPKDIFAVTHTKSMADEAYKRIKRLNPSITGSALESQICTIHALCYRILRKEGDSRRPAESWRVARIIKDKAEKLWPEAGQRPGWKEVSNWINAPKGKGMTVTEDSRYYVERLGHYHGTRMDRMREHFDETLRRENLLTFSDMLLDTEVMLRNNKEMRERWQAKVKYMIVDEGQDTSGQAMRILATLAAPQNRFFIVGDTDQLLFRFAGATPEANLFAGFEERYEDGKMVHLATNYRSTKRIVESQMRLIVNNYSNGGGPYEDKYLKSVSARPDAEDGEDITFDQYEVPAQEAEAVVANIVEDLANGMEPGGIFVGARTRAQLGYLEGPLVRAGVPYINITGGSFWTLRHIKMAVAYLRLAFDESDTGALKTVYNVASKWNVHPWGESEGEYCSHRYLGKAFLAAVGEDYRKAKVEAGSYSTKLRRSFMPGLNDLVGFVQSIQVEMAASDTIAGPMEVIVEDCLKDYIRAEDGLVSDAEAGEFDDFETLKEVAAGFASAEDFLTYVTNAVAQAEAVKDKDWSHYVVLSTVHRLKGLEREVVYGIGMSEGYDKKSGEPRGLLPHTFSLVEPPNDGVLPTGGKGRVEDERCVAFVLVSRAKSRVHLSGVERYRGAVMGPSRFVYELGIPSLTKEQGDAIPL